MKYLFVSFAVLAMLGSALGKQMPGGLGDEKPADDTVNKIVEENAAAIKDSALEAYTASGANVDAESFKAASIKVLGYKTQVVAGLNYFVKVEIQDKIFFVKMYRNLQQKVSVGKAAGPKEATESISYF